MSKALPLGEVLLHRQSGQDIIAWDGREPIVASQLVADVAVLSSLLSDHAGQQWALYCENSYYFLVGLLGMLHAGIRPVLPMNVQPNTVQGLEDKISGMVSDIDPGRPHIALPLGNSGSQPDASDTGVTMRKDFSGVDIDIYTSGSTGDAEVIPKTIGQFEREIQTLEATWEIPSANTCFVATVSHQHIYGLLFRLLWPLCSGRSFSATRFEFPEELAIVVSDLHHDKRVGSVIVSSPAHIKRVSSLSGLSGVGKLATITFSSGGPLQLEANAKYQEITESAVIEVFGSSETGGVGYRKVNPLNLEDDSIYWRVLNGVSVRLSPTSQLLEVQSPYCFVDGWFEMGDRVSLDSQGRFLLKGRADRVAKIEEKRVSLSGVEAELRKHQWVDEARVIVIEGRRQCLGAVVQLSVLGQQEQMVRSKREMVVDLKASLLETFEAVVLPRKWRFVSALPVNAQGKIVLRDLENMFYLQTEKGVENG